METHPIRKGSLFGGILLVAGCAIGAGMLGLPVLSAKAGFVPSTLTFILCWLFMVCTGLLLLEVNLWMGREISIVTMAEKTLGPVGKAVSWLVFLFLFYCLMVAYTAASGSLVIGFIHQLTGYRMETWMGNLIFSLIAGVLIYFGTMAVDWFNRLLMLGLVLTYIALVALGAQHVDTSFLAHRDWSAVTMVIPAAIVSFGYHNMIPSLNNYLNGNLRGLRLAIIIGSMIPLAVYLVWEWLILGLIPAEGFQAALDQGEMATQTLEQAVGASWVSDVAQAFAFFAIVTSFLGVALSFVDFLSDGLKIRKTQNAKILLLVLVLVPPFICALIYPTIFLMALNYAGGFGAVILFGILPALMVWKGRDHHPHFPRLVPGGKWTLAAVILFSVWVMTLQL